MYPARPSPLSKITTGAPFTETREVQLSTADIDRPSDELHRTMVAAAVELLQEERRNKEGHEQAPKQLSQS